MPTATSVVADLVAVVKNSKLGVNGRQASLAYKEKKLKSDEQIASKYFLLLHVEDRAGVLAQIANVFSRVEMSIESVMQPATPDQYGAELIITTHNASKAALNQVLAEFGKLSAIRTIKSVYRVEG